MMIIDFRPANMEVFKNWLEINKQFYLEITTSLHS